MTDLRRILLGFTMCLMLMCFAGLGPVLAESPPTFMAHKELAATVLFQDDFGDSLVDTTVYKPLGNAILTETGGKLFIETFGDSDGVSIVVPPDAACISVRHSANQSELDIGEGWEFTGILLDSLGNDQIAFQARYLRPFWNRCQIIIKVGDDVQFAGFWGCNTKSPNFKKACPEIEDIQIDWLPGDEIQIEVKDKDGKVVYRTNRKSKLKHDGNDWKAIEIRRPEKPFSYTCPSPGGNIVSQETRSKTGAANLTLELDDIVITDDHPLPPAMPVVVTPSEAAPGDFIDDMLVQVTDFPLFANPDFHLTMGAGFFLSDLSVLNDSTVTVDVSVDSLIRPQGHGIQVTANDTILAGSFNVVSFDTLADTLQPTLDFECPGVILENDSFNISFVVDDASNEYVAIEAVIEVLGTENIVIESNLNTVAVPDTVSFDFQGLPAGDYLLLGISDDGVSDFGGTLCSCTLNVRNPVNVDDPSELPQASKLFSSLNKPNPFNPATEIVFFLPEDSRVRLVIFDVLGRRVATLLDENRVHGWNLVKWDGRDKNGRETPSGTYFYRISAGERSDSRRMILVR